MKFKYEGQTYDIAPLDALTFDEIEEIEDRTGLTFDSLIRDRSLLARAKVLRTMILLAVRKANPDITYEALGPVNVLDLLDTDDDDAPEVVESVDPTTAEPSPSIA